MSTLVTHHDGLERVLRGFGFLFSPLRPARPPARIRRATTARPGAASPAPAPASVRSVAAPQQISPAADPSLLQRWIAKRARRRAEEDLEALMRADPRMRSELTAIRSYNEWHD